MATNQLIPESPAACSEIIQCAGGKSSKARAGRGVWCTIGKHEHFESCWQQFVSISRSSPERIQVYMYECVEAGTVVQSGSKLHCTRTVSQLKGKRSYSRSTYCKTRYYL